MGNWLDKTIEWLDPEAGARRLRARASLEAAHLVQRAYDAAQRGRRGDGWIATGGDANAEIAAGMATIQARCRDLVRNNPHAKAAVSALVRHMVRTGIKATWTTQQAQKDWEAWNDYADLAGELTFDGLQGLMVNAWFESGEALGRFVVPAKEYRGRIPLSFQVLESDYLDASKTGLVGEGGKPVVAGKEYDPATGRVLAYWLFPDHPGNLIGVARKYTSTRVPAADVVHLYRKTRPGQLRGVSELAVGVMRFRDHGDYRDALLLKKKIEACFVGFVKGAQGQNAANGQPATDTSGANRRIERFSPGMIIYGGSDEEMTFGQPSSVADDGGFSRDELRAIAVGAGVTYEQLTGDLSQVNYSSIRAGLVEFRMLVETLQWLTLAPMFLHPVARRWAHAGYHLGQLQTAPDNLRASWTMPKMDQVDPLKETLATKEDIAGLLKTPSDAIRERGEDFKTFVARYAADLETLRAAGIPLEGLLGTPAKDKAAKADPAQDGADQGDTAEGDPAKGGKAAKAKRSMLLDAALRPD